MLFNSTLQGFDDDAGNKRLAAIRKIAAGRDISGVAQVRGSGALIGVQALMPGSTESWAKLRGMGVDERLVAIRNPGLRAKLVEEARDWEKSWLRPDWMYYLGDGVSPDHTLGSYNNLASMAEAAGEHWAETLLRISGETDGRALFNHVGENQNLKALRDLFAGGVFFGVGDAGAHVGMVMDAGWATFVLSHWIREDGLFTMGEGIRRLTSSAARILGLKDRGALTPGMRADINVFDADKVAETHPYRVTDFPAGASRLTQGSIGYKATLVNGEVHVIDGELTDARAGEVLRHEGVG